MNQSADGKQHRNTVTLQQYSNTATTQQYSNTATLQQYSNTVTLQQCSNVGAPHQYNNTVMQRDTTTPEGLLPTSGSQCADPIEQHFSMTLAAMLQDTPKGQRIRIKSAIFGIISDRGHAGIVTGKAITCSYKYIWERFRCKNILCSQILTFL